MENHVSIESHIQQDPLGKEIRREESSVLTSGTAVLVFGIWTALKICVGILLNQKELNEMLQHADVPPARLLVGFIIGVIAFVLISISAHVYIGVASRSLAMDLKIKPGEYVALVGRTGCGKSTLMRLLLGFEKPQKGAIYYDGKDMNSLDLRALRKKIGVVTQDGGQLRDA